MITIKIIFDEFVSGHVSYRTFLKHLIRMHILNLTKTVIVEEKKAIYLPSGNGLSVV